MVLGGLLVGAACEPRRCGGARFESPFVSPRCELEAQEGQCAPAGRACQIPRDRWRRKPSWNRLVLALGLAELGANREALALARRDWPSSDSEHSRVSIVHRFFLTIFPVVFGPCFAVFF